MRVLVSEDVQVAYEGSPTLRPEWKQLMSNRHETRSLWGQEFDIVKAGLAEDQVAAFVEDLLKRYGDLLGERKHLENLRLLAEARVREAEKLVSSILQEARTKIARENRQLSHGQIVVTDNKFNHEGDTQTDARPDEPGLETLRHPPEESGSEEVVVTHERQAEMTSYHSEEFATPEETTTTREAYSPRDERAFPSPCPYEVDIQLQLPGVTAEFPGVVSLHTHLEQSPEMSLSDYKWSPSSGWIFTVLVQSTRPLTSLLTEIPEIESVVEEETPSEVPISSSTLLRVGTSSPEPSRTSPKRVRIWLKEE